MEIKFNYIPLNRKNDSFDERVLKNYKKLITQLKSVKKEDVYSKEHSKGVLKLGISINCIYVRGKENSISEDFNPIDIEEKLQEITREEISDKNKAFSIILFAVNISFSDTSHNHTL